MPDGGTEAGIVVAAIAAIGGITLKLLDKLLPSHKADDGRPPRPTRITTGEREQQLDTRMARWMDHIEEELDECRVKHRECEERDRARAQEVATLQLRVAGLRARLGVEADEI